MSIHLFIYNVMLMLLFSTIVVEPGCIATVTEYGDIEMMVCHKNLKIYCMDIIHTC